jgi:hypothetical protein
MSDLQVSESCVASAAAQSGLEKISSYALPVLHPSADLSLPIAMFPLAFFNSYNTNSRSGSRRSPRPSP